MNKDIKDATSAIVAGEWKFVESEQGQKQHPTWDLWQGEELSATIVLVPQVTVRYCPMVHTEDARGTVNLTPVLSLREAQISCADYLATV